MGSVRSNNEDNFIVNYDLSNQDWFVPNDNSDETSLGKSGAILVVADGMGGMNAGEVASAIAVDTIKTVFSGEGRPDSASSFKDIEAFLKDSIVKADANIKAKVKEDESTSGMGTTIVIAWILDKTVHIAWCGDSRAYLFNPSSGLKRLSKDHSYVQELVNAGKLDPELAFDHPNSNIITRSLGDCNAKARPDYISQNLSSGDVVLLCSDGLCGLCRDEEIAMILAGAEDVETCRNELISAAIDAGGYDNVTVALFEVKSIEDEQDHKMSDTTNDLDNLRNRKKRLKITACLTIVALAAVAVICLYASEKSQDILEFVKEKYDVIRTIFLTHKG